VGEKVKGFSETEVREKQKSLRCDPSQNMTLAPTKRGEEGPAAGDPPSGGAGYGIGVGAALKEVASIQRTVSKFVGPREEKDE